MADDNALKSSYELAMEQLRKKDEEASGRPRPIADAQKTAIAKVRRLITREEESRRHVIYSRSSRRAPTHRRSRTRWRRNSPPAMRERFESARDAKIENIARAAT